MGWMEWVVGFCSVKKRYQNAFVFRPFCLKEPGVVCNVTIKGFKFFLFCTIANGRKRYSYSLRFARAP